MLINPRVPFLFLLTTSFMGMWSQDVQPSAETVIAEAFAQRRFETIAAVEEKPAEVATQPVGSAVCETEFTVASTHMELPDYIAAGTYRAVNHEGEVSVVVVQQTEANENLTARDFYTHESGTDRWYLILLDHDAVAGLPDVSTSRQ